MERTESVAPTNMVSRSSFVADPLFIRLEPVIGSGFGKKIRNFAFNKEILANNSGSHPIFWYRDQGLIKLGIYVYVLVLFGLRKSKVHRIPSVFIRTLSLQPVLIDNWDTHHSTCKRYPIYIGNVKPFGSLNNYKQMCDFGN